MKINKLLFFLLALVSLNSCVEYVDNGTKPDGPETPEEQKYTAEQENPNDAKYVGDKFVFKAMLNNVDVTSTSKFKVNGTIVSGNSYTPHKTGSHSVVATMDNFEATFKFTVLEKEEEPEPTGNRIDYEGQSKPVTNTFWVVYVDDQEEIKSYSVPTQGGGTLPCTKWLLVSADVSNPANLDTANNSHLMIVYVPIDMTDPTKPALWFPNEAPQTFFLGGVVTFNGVANAYEAEDNNYTFVSATQPDNTGKGDADYTAESLLETTKTAKLFWNGQYEWLSIEDDAPKAKGIKSMKKFNFSKTTINPNKALKLKK